MTEPSAPEREVEITWQHVRSVWWLIIWRWGVIGIVGSIMIGMAISALIADRTFADVIGSLFGAAWSALACFIVVRMALDKRYQGFRIALLAR